MYLIDQNISVSSCGPFPISIIGNCENDKEIFVDAI